MFSKPEFKNGWLVCLLGVIGAGEPSSAPPKNALVQGEVGRNDVYVRSGASMNHYTICKLQAGDRVTIVAEQGEWYEILPPPGTFSLVSGEYVDTVDEQSGVVNGDNVRVRAGSSLNDQKYTVQAALSRGAKVKILGRNPDGFFRIEPPAGATVWINRAFVERVPDALLKLEAEGGPPVKKTATDIDASAPAHDVPLPPASDATPKVVLAKKTDASSVDRSTKGPALMPSIKPADPEKRTAADPKPVVQSRPIAPDAATVPSPLSLVPPSEQRRGLEELDAAVDAEVAKQPTERNFEPIIEGYKRIASQSEDEFAQRYAEARLGQLESMASLVGTLRRIRELNEEAEIKRRQFMQERANADFVTLPAVLTGFDAQGELRTSALYPPGTQPRRLRLIDPAAHGRTVGYVEIPTDSNIVVEGFLGRFVGVRASEKRLQVGGVDPVPIYIVRELVILQPIPLASSSGQS